MYRNLLATTLVTSLIGTVGVSAASTKKQNVEAEPSAQVRMQQRNAYPDYPSKPRWAAPQQCFTDDGYGRYTPCEGGGKGY
jgi:hypothetical protein